MSTTDRTIKTPDWRSKATFDAYQEKVQSGHLTHGCRLCEAEPLAEFEYWYIIPNNFPYDRVADVHHMIVPKRHTDGDDLSTAELKELDVLKKTELNTRAYNYIMQSLPNQMSIPAHLHYHLLKVKTFADVDV
jgi:diadenosine tetraphosphate (Ap4A) HIT family hydrolase